MLSPIIRNPQVIQLFERESAICSRLSSDTEPRTRVSHSPWCNSGEGSHRPLQSSYRRIPNLFHFNSKAPRATPKTTLAKIQENARRIPFNGDGNSR